MKVCALKYIKRPKRNNLSDVFHKKATRRTSAVQRAKGVIIDGKDDKDWLDIVVEGDC